MMRIDLTGKKYGRLTVIKEVDPYVSIGKKIRKRSQWICKCDCGNVIKTLGESLTTGNTKSCGCIQKDGKLKKNYIHGESRRSKEYRTWSKIKGRCYCQTDVKYYAYGARGIKVCDRWLASFTNFLQDMGRCPNDKYSIERIDNNGNYEPSNCKWATNKEQCINKRTSINIELNGIRMNLSQWCEKYNLKYESTRRKIRNKNISLQEIINSSINLNRLT